MSDATAEVTVGMLGLGAIGRPMADRLLAGHGHLLIASRRAQPDLADAGAALLDSARELGARADVVLAMLPDLPELEQVLAGPDGLLADAGDLLLLIGSTSSAPGVRDLAARIARETDGRVRVVDCPVSGGVDGAAAGTLSIMLGGDPADTALAARVLAPCGSAVHLGPLGAGEVAKACNQLVVAATITALGEATVLAERSGLDLQALWTLLSGGYAGSRLLTSRLDQLVAGTDEPSGVARYMQKDLGFVDDIARATGTAPVLLPALRAAFDELVDAGLGDRDIAVTRRFIAGRTAAAPASP
ncbi:NAD(P)-dependent oxidoreductase [Microbacterium sp. 22242]|uniref:NAD(P)-dependent oxidoreductase n=1 Tax=Microbacterium sp. 22242 TaxID=3453896 RepID=UPI003F8651D4